MKKGMTIVIFFALLFVAFKNIPRMEFYVPPQWPKPLYDFSKNPLSASKIELGRSLFYDPILSRDATISCSSCHLQYTAFSHVDHAISHGIEDRIGLRNSPVLVNMAWQTSFMWDGAVNHLDVQALAPISHPDEMDEKPERVIQKLKASAIYQKLFFRAYGDSLITSERMLKSLSQFMLTFISANARYDSVMRNEARFSVKEQNGYTLFKKHCASCHQEPFFTNGQFKNNGLAVDRGLLDYGRMRVTGKFSDSLLFKVPSLRNVEFSYPYMHDGRFKTLYEVVDHYSGAVIKSKTLSIELCSSINLSTKEIVDLVAFLLTLTDRYFLFNPKFSYPKHILMPTNQ